MKHFCSFCFKRRIIKTRCCRKSIYFHFICLDLKGILQWRKIIPLNWFIKKKMVIKFFFCFISFFICFKIKNDLMENRHLCSTESGSKRILLKKNLKLFFWSIKQKRNFCWQKAHFFLYYTVSFIFSKTWSQITETNSYFLLLHFIAIRKLWHNIYC